MVAPFKSQIHTLMIATPLTNKEKGDLYEMQVKHHIINVLGKRAYLWSETPEVLLVEKGIVKSPNTIRLLRQDRNTYRDTGVDIIQIEDDGTCALVQCKNGYKSGLTMTHVGSFFVWMVSMEHLKTLGYLYYTNTISSHLTKMLTNPRLTCVKLPFIEPTEPIELIPEPIVVSIIARDYQHAAKLAFMQAFETTNRGIMSMPCGTGKTLVSYLISQEFNQIVIISPLRQFARQNINKFVEYGYNGSQLLVSSDGDGERDPTIIRTFIEQHQKFIISSTFASVDVIDFNAMINPLIIVDEFHNLSRSNVSSVDDSFYKLLNSNNKIMFMSATPRVYEIDEEICDSDDESDDDDETDVKYNSTIFGSIVFNMSFHDAIKHKYISDYRVWLPTIHEDNNDLCIEIGMHEIESSVRNKCMYLYSCLLNNGSRKCIVYCIDIAETEAMMAAMHQMNTFYSIDFESAVIISNVNYDTRTNILQTFAAPSDKIQLIFSVRILDECIDIPSCDSIYITYPSQNNIRTVQRLCRCIRPDILNPHKVGNIYIWCDEYTSTLDILGGIKEYDLFFKDKISLNTINFYGKSNKINIPDELFVKNYLIGIREFRQLPWIDKLRAVEHHIIETKSLPSTVDKSPQIQRLGQWFSSQKTQFRKNNMPVDIRIEYEKLQTKYSDLFKSTLQMWIFKLTMVKEHIQLTKKMPSMGDVTDETISEQERKKIYKMCKWLSRQKTQYNDPKKAINKAMGRQNIRAMYEIFMADYPTLFQTDIDNWFVMFAKVTNYVDSHNRERMPPKPSKTNKNEDTYLGGWVSDQQKNYKLWKTTGNGIMKNDNIRIAYEELRQLHSKLFLTIEQKWMNNLNELKEYINIHNDLPTEYSNKQLGKWVGRQQINYRNKLEGMKNPMIIAEYTKLRNTHPPELFMMADEKWDYMFERVKNYINTEKCTPSEHNESTKTLGQWLGAQQRNYKNGIGILNTTENRLKYDMFRAEYAKYLTNSEILPMPIT